MIWLNIGAAYELKFYFISTGKRTLMKIIDFENVINWEGEELYNLGFGDYDFDTTGFNDSSHTDNNDGRKVFNTVLKAIQRFFDLYPSCMLMIQGSDSTLKFKKSCQLICKRNCRHECRKFNQRIRIYRNYLKRHFSEFSCDFDFLGGYNRGFVREPYAPGRNYDSIYISKKKKL